VGPEIVYEGVSFANLRAAIAAIYFMYPDMPEAEWRAAQRYVIPMQHNFENPIEPGSQDTWIQFWIDEDDRLTQDANAGDANGAQKVARVTLRFLGRRAEVWAKIFHHLTKRKSVPGYFAEYCNAEMLEYVSPVVPVNVDYFKVGNTTIAHDLSFSLRYIEYMEFNNEPLGYISVAPGNIG
jgi:hypothetical protein